MYHFFVEQHNIYKDYINITGSDVNHIDNVLRLNVGETINICDGKGMEYNCSIDSLTKEVIRCKIQTKMFSKSELPVEITLFQGAPKLDKMEMIVQKTTELGVHAIRPIVTSRTIVKFDSRKVSKKVSRWQKIAESAAKQSKRGVIPEVFEPITFKQMIASLEEYDMIIVPYENEEGMAYTREIFEKINKDMKIAIVIGPEGGISDEEILELRNLSANTVTLGNRILRTETAGLATIAMISYQIEEV